MRSNWSASSRSGDLGTFSGAFLENRCSLGFLVLSSEREDGLSVLATEGLSVEDRRCQRTDQVSM